jgi:putative hydrolase of the HAD superfamily
MQKTSQIDHNEIKAVIFDMDNTLFDFVEAKLRACKAVVELVGETEEMELIDYFLASGKGIETLENIADYLKDRNLYTDETYDKSVEVYERVKLDSIEAYDGVRETLEELKTRGLTLALVTDADEDNAMKRLNKTDLKKYFDIFISTDMTGKKKPAPDGLLLAIEKLGLKTEEIILVGDSLRRDIDPAKKLGMVTVYAAYGDRNFLEWKRTNADFIVDHVSELIGIINGN